MFNYGRVQKAEKKYEELETAVLTLLWLGDFVTTSWTTLAKVKEVTNNLKKQQEERRERDKIESIMRDLLKSNVFKQV